MSTEPELFAIYVTADEEPLYRAAPDLLSALQAIARIDGPQSGDRTPIRFARHIAKCAITKATT